MHIFDYRFLKENAPGQLVGISNMIADLHGRESIRRMEHPETFRQLRENALIETVKGSNAIEGIVTSGKRMKALMKEGAEPQSHSEEEILGYRDALSEIYTEGFDSDVSEELLKHFHWLMLRATSPEAGSYKKENNWIQERDESGRIRVRFVPVSAGETPDAMAQWLMAYYEARQDAAVSRLLLAACAAVDFLCIHPFTDGNGRVSRLLTSLLLQQAGIDIGRYISIDAKINEYKYGYYQALKAASDGWHENRNDYAPFMTFLLQILYACYKELDEKFAEGQVRLLPKHRQIETILLNSYVPISKAELVSRLPDISVSTIERVMGDMLREGKIVKIGTYRNARYKVK